MANIIIKNVDCREGLKEISSETIDCVITSPPYWATRDYQVEPLIWDDDPSCEHDFKVKELNVESSKNKDFNARWKGSSGKRKQEKSQQLKIEWGICTKCNAVKGSLGLEFDFNLYIKHLCDIFDQVKRVLKKSGTCWVVIADTHYTVSGGKFLNDTITAKGKGIVSGVSQANLLKSNKQLPQKSLVGIPFRFAIEMMNRGWILRNTIIWNKPNVIPTSATDRFTVNFEYVFFFVKSRKYYFKQQVELAKTVVKSPYRNKRTVWSIPARSFSEDHHATFPYKLVIPMIEAGCPKTICTVCDSSSNNCGCGHERIPGKILDPFCGSGTVGLLAQERDLDFIGFELNPDYMKLINKRMKMGRKSSSLIV